MLFLQEVGMGIALDELLVVHDRIVKREHGLDPEDDVPPRLRGASS